MKIFGIILLILMAGCQNDNLDSKISLELQDVSVTIRTATFQGSGLLRTHDGMTYVWTAGHVVAGLKKLDIRQDPITKRAIVTEHFETALIFKEIIHNNVKIGSIVMEAEVYRYNPDSDDLGILLVKKKYPIMSSVRFDLDDDVFPLGTNVVHLGGFEGAVDINMTDGIISRTNQVYEGKNFDSTTCTCFHGSSGGGVFLRDGRCIGLLSKAGGETLNLFVPVRRMKIWAKENRVEFLLK